MKTHFLKTWPEYFQAVVEDRKPFEIRRNDRDYAVGDVLVLQEWCPVKGDYTGNYVKRCVSYLTDFEQKPGFVVLGLAKDADAVAVYRCRLCGYDTMQPRRLRGLAGLRCFNLQCEGPVYLVNHS